VVNLTEAAVLGIVLTSECNQIHNVYL